MENMTFEAALERLDVIVKKLEAGECTLEESFALFEEGTALSKSCYSMLETAKMKIRTLEEEEQQS